MIKKKYDIKKVLSFLKSNPNFFVDNPNILQSLSFPLSGIENLENNRIISFKDWIINKLQKKQKQIITNAKFNFFTQKLIHEAILKIIKIDDFKSLILSTKDLLPRALDLDCLVFASSFTDIEKFGGVFISKEKIDSIFLNNQKIIMDAVDEEIGIFKSYNFNVYSNALYSLNKNIFDSPSFLAFGSKEKIFINNNNKGSDLLSFLCEVFQERCMQLKKK